jgi:hypothetical protein
MKMIVGALERENHGAAQSRRRQARRSSAPQTVESTERSEDERRTDARESKKLGDIAAHRFEHDLADRRFEDDEREDDLEAEAPRNRGPIDRSTIRGKGVPDSQDDEGAKHRLKNTEHQ